MKSNSEPESSESVLMQDWFDEARPQAYWLHPMLALYTGLFFGPWVTFLTSMLVARWRLDVRLSVFLFGTAGAAWCLVQGLTIVFEPIWLPLSVYAMRTTVNFVVGAVCFGVLWRHPAVSTRATMRNSLLFFTAAGIGWFAGGDLFWARLGR